MTTQSKTAIAATITRSLPFAGPAFAFVAMLIIGATTTVAMMMG